MDVFLVDDKLSVCANNKTIRLCSTNNIKSSLDQFSFISLCAPKDKFAVKDMIFNDTTTELIIWSKNIIFRIGITSSEFDHKENISLPSIIDLCYIKNHLVVFNDKGAIRLFRLDKCDKYIEFNLDSVYGNQKLDSKITCKKYYVLDNDNDDNIFLFIITNTETTVSFTFFF